MPSESPTELSVLQEISEKLSQLLTLTRMSNSQVIADFKKEIKKEPLLELILNLADDTLTASKLKAKIKENMKVSDDTIERRIAILMEKGALYVKKRGNEVYYGDSGLYR
jgi:predicted transcriptional regulator